MKPESPFIDAIRRHAQERPDAVAMRSLHDGITWGELYDVVETSQDWGVPSRIITDFESNSLDLAKHLVAVHAAGFTVCVIGHRLPVVARGARARSLEVNRSQFNRLLQMFPPDDKPCYEADFLPEVPPFHSGMSIVFTSGTSGPGRPVVHTVDNQYVSATGVNEYFDLKPGDSWLAALPFCHVGGQCVLWRCLLAGACLDVVEHGEDFCDVLEKLRSTHASLVPTQLRKLISQKMDHVPKAIMVGGAATPRVLLASAYAQDLPIHVTYGSTEATSTVAVGKWHPDMPDNCAGRPLPGRDVTIVNGEIRIGGPIVCAGYLVEHDIERPDSRFDQNGLLRTRDGGRLDEHNQLLIDGRMDGAIISGGENVLPEEVETALYHLDDVRQAIVVPIDNEKFGQRPVAFIDADSLPELADLRERLAELLADYQLPDAILPWPAPLPMKGAKIDRAALAALATELLARENAR